MSSHIALLLSLFVLAAFIVTGCPGDEQPQPSGVTIAFGEIVSEPVPVELEVYVQNNCGGTAETDYEVRRARVIVRQLQVNTGFEVNTKGEISVLGTGVALGAAVSGQVGSTYGTQDSLERAVTVSAAPGTRIEHEISHLEIWKTGTATVVVLGESVSIPFRYRHDFTLVLLESRQLPCGNTPTPIVTYTPTDMDDPAAVPSPSPTATATAILPTSAQETPTDNRPSTSQNVATAVPPAPIALAVQTSKLQVAGSACSGNIYRAPVDGLLEVSYEGGSYSPWTDNSVRQGQWRTVLYVYDNRISRDTTAYGPNTPSTTNRIAVIGCDTDLEQQAIAEACASKQPPVTIPVSAGKTLFFVPIDDEVACAENRGAVILTLNFTPNY